MDICCSVRLFSLDQIIYSYREANEAAINFEFLFKEGKRVIYYYSVQSAKD
jgi:hypothetical protein